MSEPEISETTDLPSEYTRATVGQRLGGIALDWLLCLIISSWVFPTSTMADATGVQKAIFAGEPLATLAIWAVQHFVLVATIGMTYGHRLFRLRVIREDGTRFPGFVAALKRTVLLGLVIPAVVWDAEGRGLHDRVSGTRVVRLNPPSE